MSLPSFAHEDEDDKTGETGAALMRFEWKVMAACHGVGNYAYTCLWHTRIH